MIRRSNGASPTTVLGNEQGVGPGPQSSGESRLVPSGAYISVSFAMVWPPAGGLRPLCSPEGRGINAEKGAHVGLCRQD